MDEKYKDTLNTLLAEAHILFVAILWTILAVMTNQSYIGLAGLAILYRHYTKKNEVGENEK